MNYNFSISAFFIGLLILIASSALTKWYRIIADNIAGGVGSYEKFRLWGLIGCGIGLIVMFNLHTLILTLIFSQFFGNK